MVKNVNVSLAYDILKRKILTCEYQPGELIAEKDIVEKLKVSRTPVREALKTLSGEGLVHIIPKKGIQIASTSLKKMKEIYEIRRLLEPLSIRQAMSFIKPADIDHLYDLDRRLHEEISKENIFEVFRIGMDVHLYIATLAKNETLLAILKMLRDEIYRSLAYYLARYLDECSSEEKNAVLNLIGGSHIHFIDALKAKDEEKAIKYILNDLIEMSTLLFKVI